MRESDWRDAPADWLLGGTARLGSGLVLGAFILCHFANLALGNVSLAAMEALRPWLSAPWRAPFGAVLLYGAVLIHFAATLRALYARRTLRMTAREGWQLGLGLALPFLLLGHVAATRIEYAWSGFEATYASTVRTYWIRNPLGGARQMLALGVAWTHVVFGLYFWLRPKRFFEEWRGVLVAVAVLVPVLAILGFAAAGRELADRPDEPLPRRTVTRPAWIEPALEAAFAVPIALVLAARARRSIRRNRHRVRVAYPGGRTVDVPFGFSVLEASRRAGVPHRSVCGGRGRCSTCRILVEAGANGQPRPGPQERETLRRIKAGPEVRLACQFRPVRDVTVLPMLSAGAPARASTLDAALEAEGREQEIVILFCDLRDFTGFAERNLPFDVVFVLNRYFREVSEAVSSFDGRIDKFIGDGAMALFGLDREAGAAARAMAAADDIRRRLAALNQTDLALLHESLDVVVAIHRGPAIVGVVGHGSGAGLTAVGDTVNVASRLEGLAKERNAAIIVSDAAAQSAGLDLAGYQPETLAIRGRTQPVRAWTKRRETAE